MLSRMQFDVKLNIITEKPLIKIYTNEWISINFNQSLYLLSI